MSNLKRVMINIKQNSLIRKTALVAVLLVVGMFSIQLFGQNGNGLLDKTSGQGNEVKQVAFTGNFRDMLTGMPIENVKLVTVSEDGTRAETYSNQKGFISMKIPQGTTVFEAYTLEGSPYQGLQTTINITGPELHYDFRMSKSGEKSSDISGIEDEPGYTKVVGYVIDENGTALPGVKIQVTNSSVHTFTDESGKYVLRVSSRDPGMYPKLRTYGAGIGQEFMEFGYSFSKVGYQIYEETSATAYTESDPSSFDSGGTWTSDPLRMRSLTQQQNNLNQSYKTPQSSGGFNYGALGNQNYSDCLQRAIIVLYNGSLVSANPPCCGGGAITCTQTIVLSVEDYVRRVLPHEWLSNWHLESYKAAAVVIRSYVLYRALYYPASTNNYHAKAGPCFQAFGGTYSATDPAVAATTGQILIRPDGNVAMTEYSSENNNLDPQCSGAGNTTNPGYGNGNVAECSGSMVGPSNGFSDIVGLNRLRAGHGKGMCQRCSQSWASGVHASTWCGFAPGVASNVGQSTGQGQKGYTWIINHYYPSFTLTTVPLCSYPCGNITNLSCSSSQTFTNQTTVGGSNYFLLYNNVNCLGWNMNGPEKVYKITPTNSGTLTVSTSNVSNTNLRAFIVYAYDCTSLDPSTITPPLISNILAYGTTATSTISCSVSAGQSYFIVVDGKQASGSTTGQSGTYSITITQPACTLPNLAHSSGSILNLTGSSLTYTINIQNNGTGNSSSARFRLYLSTNATYGAGDVYFAGHLLTVPLQPGYYFSGTGTKNLLSYVGPGTYYIISVIDPLFEITESNEGDNEIPSSSSFVLTSVVIGEEPTPPITEDEDVLSSQLLTSNQATSAEASFSQEISDWLSLDPENGWTATVSSGEVITITNMLGQVITTLESREDGEIWLPKLPSGVYVISICCDGLNREKVGKITY